MSSSIPESLETDVPAVPAVQPLPDKERAGTPPKMLDVPGVPEQVSGTISGIASALANAGVPLQEVSVPMEERPQFRVYESRVRIEESNRELRPGVWWHSVTKAKGKGEEPTPTETWVCGPLSVEAQTCDRGSNSYGRLLRFRNTRQQWRDWAMPMSLLRGSGEELRGELLNMGLSIAPRSRDLLNDYLQAHEPRRKIRCAMQTGWCDGVFVLPQKNIGPGADDVVFQAAENTGTELATSGTLEGWQKGIAAYAPGNPLVLLALSVAFAGPLLQRCNSESGGIHLLGNSSIGKTTALQVAVSAWGAPSYRRGWRATANGLEGAAALHNDGLLALDEISEADPRDVGNVVYMVANERGKQRATRSGAARTVTTWRCALLSSGERTIGATMAEGGKRQKAGQTVRLLDIPTEAPHGLFDELHGFVSGRELSDHLKSTCAEHYGHAVRQFIAKLADDETDMSAALETMREQLQTNGMEGQEKRAAGRLAVFALAGELATDYGITGWPEGAALAAAQTGFAAWRKQRGQGQNEHLQIIEALSLFLDRHGDGRCTEAGKGVSVRDRAGWWQDAESGRIYLLTKDGMREALNGFDFKRALDALQQTNILQNVTSGERAKPERIDGRRVRVYAVSEAALREANHVD